jgi:chemotaxis signal transduction protein
VVLYGKKIMKLIPLTNYVEGATHKSLYGDETVPVIVHYHKGQPIGFIVKKVHNIVNVPTQSVMITQPQRGIMGSVIVNDAVMSILNVQEILSLSGMGPFNDPAFVHDEEAVNAALAINGEVK